MPTRWLRVGGLEFQWIPEIPNLIAPGVCFAHESHSVRPAFAMLWGKKSMSDFSPAFQGVEGPCYLVSSYSWGLKCWFPMEIRQILPRTIDDQPQAVRFHRRFDFNDAMHHRMLRTMYCKLARCKAGIAVFNARCNFVCLSCCAFQLLMLVRWTSTFHFCNFWILKV